AFDAARHQVAVRRLAVGEAELAAQVSGRHVHAPGQCLDVQRPRVLAVDAVPDAAQPREVAQVRWCGGFAAHSCDRATSGPGCPVPFASRPVSGSPGRSRVPAEVRTARPWPPLRPRWGRSRRPGIRSAGPVRPMPGVRPVTAAPPPPTVDGLLPLRRLSRTEGGEELHALLWTAGPGWRMISSAVLGGGLGEREWILNAQVSHGYRRTDPDRHLASLAAAAGMRGPGVGLMTAADVSAYGHGHDEGAEAVATVGISVRGWAASAREGADGAPAAGTINIVVALPVALGDAALVNAVSTATEAKVQALLEAGYDCSGTPTDAVCVAARVPSPGEETHAFAGPRSVWGARLARAVHGAVRRATPAP